MSGVQSTGTPFWVLFIVGGAFVDHFRPHTGLAKPDTVLGDTWARLMVIPYMPMLVPPTNWTGYDKGAYLFLLSYVMHTHGATAARRC